MYRCIPSLVLTCVSVFNLYTEKALPSQDLFTRLSIIIFLEITYLRERNLCLLPFSLRLTVLLIFLLMYSMMSLCWLWKPYYSVCKCAVLWVRGSNKPKNAGPCSCAQLAAQLPTSYYNFAMFSLVCISSEWLAWWAFSTKLVQANKGVFHLIGISP